jgi:putative phosphonate metabolism protein
MTMSSEPRYALYFAPHESGALGRLGSEWLGRCAASGRLLDQPALRGVDAKEFNRLTAAPRRYGLHATLKAPFRLAEGRTLRGLLAEVHAWCAAQPPFQMPALKVRLLEDFLALVPGNDVQRVNAVAAECVMRFDAYRAPLTSTEIAKRAPHRLDARAARMLDLWGYPHVLDLFRFHLSLTGPLPEDGPLREALRANAEARFAHPGTSAEIFDSACVFEEPAPGADFRLIERARFSA